MSFDLINEQRRTLVRMGEDLEEGEIYDAEEISEQDFNKQEVKVIEESKQKANARVWKMQDLCIYPGFGGYASGLYNLAWAQAVQSKPRNEFFAMEFDGDRNSRRSSPSSSSNVNNSEGDKKNGGVLGIEVHKVVIDDSADEMDVKTVDVEKEEGELEEGEIDSDMEYEDGEEDKDRTLSSANELENGDSIRVDLGDAEKSFERECSRLENTLDSLGEAVLESNIPVRNIFFQLYFSTIQTIHSVLCSMNYNMKDQNKDAYLRLLSLVKNRGPPFSPEQMKEVEVMKRALDSSHVLSCTKTCNKEKDMRVIDSANKKHSDTSAETAVMLHNAPKVDSARGLVSSRKQKSVEESIMNGPPLKRQRHGLESSRAVKDLKDASGTEGWLEDTDMAGSQFAHKNQLTEKAVIDPRKMDDEATSTSSGKPNVMVSRNEQVPVTSTSSTTTLPAFLKNVAVDPSRLINILQIGQQKLAAETQQKSADPVKNAIHPSSSDSILGALPLVNVAPSKASGLLQKPAGIHPVPSQIIPMDESGKNCMKPRDPRHVLHSNTLQRSGSLVPEQFTNGFPRQGGKHNHNGQKQEGLADTKAISSPSIEPQDISRQFIKNLSIVDIISVSQESASPPIVSQNPHSQPVQIKSAKLLYQNSDEQRTGAGSTPGVGAAGASHSLNAWGDVEHLFEGYDDGQKAAIRRERTRRIEEQKKMFAAHKLSLVLDLDHTLLNSAKFAEVDPMHDEILKKKEEQDREKPQRHLFRLPHMGMWTKLRPGIWNFLEKASKRYELHIYTMGNKVYATEMAKILDPKGLLFAGRVFSRGDEGDPFDGDEMVPKTKDLEGVLGMESGVVIVDDSIRVWPHNKMNLIAIERYTYFPCSRRQFGLLGPSLLEIDHDERLVDGTLASSLAIIERVHQIFFCQPSLEEADVREILASEQRKILSGCRIVFSRVFPLGEANPHRHHLWQTAEQFGAVCTNQIDEQVTHVVANSFGTDKVNWALSTGRFVVRPSWVEASALLYRRANEQNFAINP